MRILNKVVPDEEYKPSGTTLFILSECNRKSCNGKVVPKDKNKPRGPTYLCNMNSK